MASVTFRLAVVKGQNLTYISNANAAYDFVRCNIDGDGWLRNTVDPLTFDTLSGPDDPSPEGQSFVLLLESARRDFQDWAEVTWGVTRVNSAKRNARTGWGYFSHSLYYWYLHALWLICS